MVMTRFRIGAALMVGATLVQARVSYDPVAHMLIQFPLLIAAGYVLGLGRTVSRDWFGVLLVLVITASAFWMLPRSLDGAVNEWGMHVAKFISLPLCIGLPLALIFSDLHPLLRGFLKAQAVSMCGILAFLYIHAPIRLCNSYLLDDQKRLGFGFLMLAMGLGVLWSIPIFSGRPIRFPARFSGRGIL